MGGAMLDHSPAVSVPRLQTPRLLLREYRVPDFDAYAAHLADPLATTFIGSYDRRMAWRFFAGNMGEWLLKGAGWWGVELRETGEFVGNVGAFIREGWPEIELGWNVFRAHWRRGIATEAAAEVMRHAFDVRGEKRVTALVAPGNAASLKVAARLGMTLVGEADFFGKPVGRYARDRGATSSLLST
jgi:RimJ/RimL family protein N-acetyltransferase